MHYPIEGFPDTAREARLARARTIPFVRPVPSPIALQSHPTVRAIQDRKRAQHERRARRLASVRRVIALGRKRAYERAYSASERAWFARPLTS